MYLINKFRLNKINESVFVSLLSGRLFFKNFTTLINIIAFLISWVFNKSFFLGVIHYLFGIWYIFYSLLIRRFDDDGISKIFDYYF